MDPTFEIFDGLFKSLFKKNKKNKFQMFSFSKNIIPGWRVAHYIIQLLYSVIVSPIQGERSPRNQELDGVQIYTF
jgi:hypothetical protein